LCELCADRVREVRITVPIHGDREIPVKTMYSIVKAAGLTVEEFERLL